MALGQSYPHTEKKRELRQDSVKLLWLTAQSRLTLQPHGLQSARLLCPWGFSRWEYWSGWPWPPPGDLPNPGIKPRSPTLQITDKTFSDLNCTNVFLGQSPKAIESKTKINKWGLIKLYKFVHNKGNHKQNEKKTRERKYLQTMWPTRA